MSSRKDRKPSEGTGILRSRDPARCLQTPPLKSNRGSSHVPGVCVPSFIFDRLAVSQRALWQKLGFKGERTAAHLWHDFNFLIASFEGQGEDLSPPIGHGWWLAVDHEVHPVGLGWGWLGVLLRTDHVQGLRSNGIRRSQDRAGAGCTAAP